MPFHCLYSPVLLFTSWGYWRTKIKRLSVLQYRANLSWKELIWIVRWLETLKFEKETGLSEPDFPAPLTILAHGIITLVIILISTATGWDVRSWGWWIPGEKQTRAAKAPLHNCMWQPPFLLVWCGSFPCLEVTRTERCLISFHLKAESTLPASVRN